MKKLLMILATIILSISIVGCSSSKYNNDIDKVINYISEKRLNNKQLERKNINIEVYDVNYNADKIKGQHNTYKVTYKNKYNGTSTDLFFILDNKVQQFTSSDKGYLINMLQKKVYEENNNKNLKAEF